MLKLPPLNPPRDTSNGDVDNELDTAASRGNSLEPVCSPFSVTVFWSAPRPSTENASASPSSPGSSSTPGSDAAIAAMLPCRSTGRSSAMIVRSVPPTSGSGTFRFTRCCADTSTTIESSCTGASRASAISTASSATRLICSCRYANPKCA